MKVKTYRAATLKAALEEIKRELGPDAFILGQKEIRPSSLLGLVQKPLVEVTAAVDHSSIPPAPPTDAVRSAADAAEIASLAGESRLPATDGVMDRVQISAQPGLQEPASISAQPSPDNQALLDEVRKLKAMVQSISASRRTTAVRLNPHRFQSSLCETLYADLVSRGIEEDLAYSLSASGDESPESVASSLASRVAIYPDFLGNAGVRGPEIMALLGPTGVGKTTTIAKIAALAAFQHKLKVGLVTLDTFRIAAVDQLKTYGEIMGISVQVVESVDQLRPAIQSLSNKDIVLIDTTGRNHREVCHDWALAEFMSESAHIRKAIVVSATTKPSDLADIVDRHQIFDPDCLIFTKLDETASHGSIVSEIIRSGLPVAYVTTGQSVPNDILRPTAWQLVDLAITEDHAKTWDRLVHAAQAGIAPHKPEATNPTRRLSY
jgi:flagellar biosynthesis protein FlhF